MRGFGLLLPVGAAVNDPGAHNEHAEAPLWPLYEPGEQMAQADWAGALWNVPIWHVAQNERPDSV